MGLGKGKGDCLGFLFTDVNKILHEFKLLQSKSNVHTCACFKGKLDFSIETPVVNQCGALCPAWPHSSVQSQNSEMENNLHNISGVSLPLSFCSPCCLHCSGFPICF